MPYSEITLTNVTRCDVGAPRYGDRGNVWRTVVFSTSDGLRLSIVAFSPDGDAFPVNVQTGGRGNAGTVEPSERARAAERLRAARKVCAALLSASDVADALTEAERAAVRALLSASEPLQGGTE
jgi:phage tail sheath protein FI